MESWVNLNKIFLNIKQAENAAKIVETTESRLSSIPRGPQYNIETEVYEVNDGWRIRWRKVFVGNDSGCKGCSSCETSQLKKMRPRKVRLLNLHQENLKSFLLLGM